MRRFGIRARKRAGGRPGRGRVLAFAAAVATVSVAGAAVVAQRSGDGVEGRRRLGNYGAVDPGATAPDTITSSGEASSTTGSPTTAGPAVGSGAVTTGGRGAPAGAPGRTGTPTRPVEAPAMPATGTSGPGPSGTGTSGTGPASTPPAAPGVAATAAPGWQLLPDAPIGGRDGHTAVWTGREMVVWGGTSDFDADPSTDGAAFDPAARSWRTIPAAPLSPRFDARGFWTGREVIVFGGGSVEGDTLGDGAAWDPATNAWRPLPASPLGPREGAVMAWAGDRLVVWGGNTVPAPDAVDAEPEMPNDGAAYVPATDRWVPLAAAPVPGRSGAESGWTGGRLVISGGYRLGEDDDRTDGVALDPTSGAWSPVSARPEPGSCDGPACDGFWTGQKLLFTASGLLYDPAADRWSVVPPGPQVDGPAPGEPATWAGERLLVWGVADGDMSADDAGADGVTGEPPANAGAAYDPATDQWGLFPGGPLGSREGHTVIWTGEAMLVWGGSTGEASFADGAAYRPR